MINVLVNPFEIIFLVWITKVSHPRTVIHIIYLRRVLDMAGLLPSMADSELVEPQHVQYTVK